MLIEFIYRRTNQRADKDFGNQLSVLVLSALVATLIFMYIRPSDWLSTAMWFDSLGFNQVIPGTFTVMSREVSKEGLAISVLLWAGNLMLGYRSYAAGPLIIGDVRGRSFSDKMTALNKEKVMYIAAAILVGVTDDFTDAAAKAGSVALDGRFLVAMGVSFVVYNILSEQMLGFSVKGFIEACMYFISGSSGNYSFTDEIYTNRDGRPLSPHEVAGGARPNQINVPTRESGGRGRGSRNSGSSQSSNRGSNQSSDRGSNQSSDRNQQSGRRGDGRIGLRGSGSQRGRGGAPPSVIPPSPTMPLSDVGDTDPWFIPEDLANGR